MFLGAEAAPAPVLLYFKGSIGSGSAALDVSSAYGTNGNGFIGWKIINVAATQAEVSVLDAYTGNAITQLLQSGQSFQDQLSLGRFKGWYDLIITVGGDSTFNYRLAGHCAIAAALAAAVCLKIH